MAFSENLQTRTYVAGAALTQFTFVTQQAAGTVIQSTAGQRATGVTLEPTASGGAASIDYDGRVMVLAAGTIARGGPVSSNATGRAVASATTNVILGYAQEAAVTGQIITIDLDRAGTLQP